LSSQRLVYTPLGISFYSVDVGHGTLFCANEGKNPKTGSAAVRRLKYAKYIYIYLQPK